MSNGLPCNRRMGLAALGGLCLPARAAPALHVVGSADWPYRRFSPGAPTGLYFDLLRAAAEIAQWPLRFTELPAARALLMMEYGDADAMVGPLRTPERERYLHYSRITLPPEDKAIYTVSTSPVIDSLDDLPGRRLGVQLGKRYGPVIDEHRQLQRIELSTYKSAMTLVQMGRLDAALVPERQGDELISELGLRLIKQPLRIAGETPYLVLSKRSAWLPRLGELEAAFDALHKNGQWAALLRQYRF